MEQNPPSDFARARRKPQRAAYDMATIHAILDAGTLCHVGHIIDGRPVVIPTFHWRHGERVFWHGSAASRMLRANAAGGEVCLTVTLLDAWVLARTSFHHSANYRSVLCFGRPTLIDDPDEKLAAMKGFVERLFPGRWDTAAPAHGAGNQGDIDPLAAAHRSIGEASQRPADRRRGGPELAGLGRRAAGALRCRGA